MNLRVDLILEDEKRSASLINLRTLAKIGTVFAPIAVVIVIAVTTLNMMTLSKKVRMEEALWQSAESKHQEALKLIERGQANEAMLNEVEGWRGSHVDWNVLLESFRRAMPVDVQLTHLSISQVLALQDGGRPARNFSMTLRGRAAGETAEGDVQTIQRHLQRSEAFEPLVDSVEVVRYGADPENRANRLFEIDCRFKQRLFQ